MMMMAVGSENGEKMEPSESMESSPSPSPSGRVSDAASDSSSSGLSSDPSDRPTPDQSNFHSPTPTTELEPQPSLRSEEYRQLFRLPPDEVLVQDFNCALQENFLLQGHMYLFVHYICFYSNLFGFETKKIIPLHEVTSVRRAKAAGIFPTAIEIMAGEKKYFFTSFLSRDEAFKLINDGWVQHVNGAKAITDQQELKSEFSSQENGIVVLEKAKSSKHPVDELDFADRSKDVPISEDFKLPLNGEAEIVSIVSSGALDNLEEGSETVLNTQASSSGKTLNIEASSSGKTLDIEGSSSGKILNAVASSSGKTLVWGQENSDAPKVPEHYTKVAESKFPVKIEDLFSLCFSDDAVGFLESFHRRCGDKDFKCTPWSKHDEFKHARDVSFQHPIKLYFGARFGSCQEIQKFRVYRSSHLVIETSQEISDVPYGDYFRVEGLWDVESDGDESECCVLRVYLNVAFSKKTMFKGKIVQSTVEECRDAYAIWIDIAHELLKQKNLEKEARPPTAHLILNGLVHLEKRDETAEPSQRSAEENENDTRISQKLPESKNVSQQVADPLPGNLSCAASVASAVRESLVKFFTSLKSQSHVPLLLMITFALILVLMQLSIVVLLVRPQQIQVIPQTECAQGMYNMGEERGFETMAWLEKRIHHLKDEMHMVESILEKMTHEHSLLKAQLKDLYYLRKQQWK